MASQEHINKVGEYLLANEDKELTLEKIRNDLGKTEYTKSLTNNILYKILRNDKWFSTHVLIQKRNAHTKKVTWILRSRANTAVESIAAMAYRILCGTINNPLSIEDIRKQIDFELIRADKLAIVERLDMEELLQKTEKSPQQFWNTISPYIIKLLSQSERLCISQNAKYSIEYDTNKIIVLIDTRSIGEKTILENKAKKLFNFGWIIAKISWDESYINKQTELYKKIIPVLENTINGKEIDTVQSHTDTIEETHLALLVGQLMGKFPLYKIYFFTYNRTLVEIIESIANKTSMMHKLSAGHDLVLPEFIMRDVEK